MQDTEAIARELVRALRGPRSQMALVRRLRYASNVVYLWESGRRYPTLASMMWLAHRTGVDVHEALDRFLPKRSRDEGEPWTVPGAAALLRDIQRKKSAAEVARHLGVSRHTAGRWLRGETEPRFPVVLEIIAHCTSRPYDFIGCFVDPESLPSAREPWRRLLAARQLVREEPWSPAITLSLELERYRALPAHEPGWIARQLGIEPEVEQRCVALLEASGQIRKEGEHYVPTGVTIMDVATPGRGIALRKWWGGVSQERTRKHPTCSGAWNLFTISDADFKRAKTLQRDYYRALRTLISESDAMDHLVLANMQLVILSETEEEGA